MTAVTMMSKNRNSFKKIYRDQKYIIISIEVYDFGISSFVFKLIVQYVFWITLLFASSSMKWNWFKSEFLNPSYNHLYKAYAKTRQKFILGNINISIELLIMCESISRHNCNFKDGWKSQLCKFVKIPFVEISKKIKKEKNIRRNWTGLYDFKRTSFGQYFATYHISRKLRLIQTLLLPCSNVKLDWPLNQKNKKCNILLLKSWIFIFN